MDSEQAGRNWTRRDELVKQLSERRRTHATSSAKQEQKTEGRNWFAFPGGRPCAIFEGLCFGALSTTAHKRIRISGR
jgi:hypothetical protein